MATLRSSPVTRDILPFLLLLGGGLVVGWAVPAAIAGDPRSLALVGLVAIGVVVLGAGLERLDLLVLGGLAGALVLFTAIYHRGVAAAALPHPFYETTLWRVTLPELLLCAAILLALLRRGLEAGPWRDRVGIEPFLVVVLLVLGLIVGVAHGAGLEAAIRDGRKVAYIGLAHIGVVLVATTRKRRRFLLGLTAAAGVFAAFGHIFDYLSGNVFFYGEFRRASVDVADFVVLLALVCMPAAFLRLRACSAGRAWAAVGLVVLGTAGTLVTFSRAAWCALPLGVAVIMLIPRHAVGRSARWASLAVLSLSLLLPLFFGEMGPLALKRIGSLAAPQDDPTVSYRLRESSGALELVAENPLLGLGFGVPFDVAPSLAARRIENRTLVHNMALWSAIKAGLPGLALLGVLFGGAVLRLARAARRHGSRGEAALALGLLAVLGMMMAMGMAGALLNQARIGFLLGFVTGLSRLLACQGDPSAGAEGAR